MKDLSEINPHLGLWQSENHVSASERAWDAWLVKVENALGVDPSGKTDETRDVFSYSVDFALDAFNEGVKAEDFARDVKAGLYQCID